MEIDELLMTQSSYASCWSRSADFRAAAEAMVVVLGKANLR